MSGREPMFFAGPAPFRDWLESHAASAQALRVGFWKRDSGRASMTWPESVDEALCYGWIDSVRRRIDDLAYEVRFTPRKAGSIWSAVNIANFERLDDAGRITGAGRAAYAQRTAARSAVYAYEQPADAALLAAETRSFKRDRAAWAFFASCPPAYRRTVLHWIVTAKKPETRAARLQKLIHACAAGERLR